MHRGKPFSHIAVTTHQPMSQESNIAVHTFYRDIAPVDSQGQVVCYHEERARLRTAHTDLNPNRDFYVCDKEKDDPDHCGFFAWADDRGICAARESRRKHLRDTIANTQAATPRRPSQAQRAQMARSPDTPISPQKRGRSPSPLSPLTPKHRRLNGFTSTPESLAARKAAIAAALKPSQGSEARLKSIEYELAAVAREKQVARPGDRQLPPTQATPSASSHRDVSGSQSLLHSVSGSPAAPPPPSPSPSPMKQNRTPVHGFGLPPSFRSRLPSSQRAQSEAAYSITDEVRRADMEDEIEDAVWIEHDLDLEDKQIQTDPIDDDDDFDHLSSVGQNEAQSSQDSRITMSSPSSSIPFTLPATRPDIDDDVYFDSGASGSPPLREHGRVSGSSPARLPPQTPSSRRAGSSRAYASCGNASAVDSAGRSTILTPPGSSQRERDHQRAEDGASSSTGWRGRGSSIHSPLLREGRGLAPSPSPSPSPSKGSSGFERSQWQMIQDDPENPFHERAGGAAALRASSQSQTSPGVDATSGSADGQPGTLSAGLVEQQIASLVRVPEYIRKLERRERAAQKSAEVKAKKIARLEEEVQRLSNINRTLEATVAALEARR